MVRRDEDWIDAYLVDAKAMASSLERALDSAAAKLMPNLFEPFYTTKPSGMRIGLPFVRSIIENHGRRICATQNPVREATLKFVLPVTPTTGGADTPG